MSRKTDILDELDDRLLDARQSQRVPIGGNAAGGDKSVSLEAREAFRFFVQQELDALCERLVAEHERHHGLPPAGLGGNGRGSLASVKHSLMSHGSHSIIIHEDVDLCTSSLAWPSEDSYEQASRRHSRRASRRGQGNLLTSLTSLLKENLVGAPSSRSSLVSMSANSSRASAKTLSTALHPSAGAEAAKSGARPPERLSGQAAAPEAESLPVAGRGGGGRQDDVTPVQPATSDGDSEGPGEVEKDAAPTLATPKLAKKGTGIRFASVGKGCEVQQSSEAASEEELKDVFDPHSAPEPKRITQGAASRQSGARPSLLGLGAHDGGARTFVLHDSWLSQVTVAASEAGALSTGVSDLDVHEEDGHETKSCWERAIVNPSCGPRMAWDICALMFMAYECVMLPLIFFNLNGESINLAARLFWSLDLPLQFFTGYQTVDGDVELRPRRVVRNYIRTWFLLDLLLITIDWVDFLVDTDADVKGARAAKATKSLRMIRLTRMMKLLYLVKHANLPDWVKAIIYRYCSSDVLSGIIGILRIFLLWVWINHVISCCWYGLALDNPHINWIESSEFAGADKFHSYILGYHWSLSLYGSSTDVHPSNVQERTFAVCATLLAFMVSAYIVSATTTSMTRVSIATAQEAKQFSILKQYLFENGISTMTSERVQRNARHAISQKKRMKAESDIELLDVISQPLRVELHFEIYMPVLGWHPFLDIASEESATFMRQVCHNALAQVTLAHHDLLFDEGEASLHQQMYFINNGGCHYRRSCAAEGELVRVGEWACEAVLWTAWIHCGSMRAGQDSALLALGSAPFQKIASQFRDCIGYAQRYASAFCRYLEDCDRVDLTDLEDKDMDVEWLASKSRVAPEPEAEARGVRASQLDAPMAPNRSGGKDGGLSGSSSFRGLFMGLSKKKDDVPEGGKSAQKGNRLLVPGAPQIAFQSEDEEPEVMRPSSSFVESFQLGFGKKKKPPAAKPPTEPTPVLPGAT